MVAGDVNVDLAQVFDSVKELETVKETDQCVALLPRAFRALFCGPEMWVMRREHKVKAFAFELEKELLKIDPIKIIEPPLYVAVPALQAVSYSMDSEELREMYVKLLAKAMNADTTENVHPSFVEIVKQLSPKDARILNSLIQSRRRPYFKLSWKRDKGVIDFVDYFCLPSTMFTLKKEVLLVSVSISNLKRLGLIDAGTFNFYTDESAYLPLMESEFFKTNQVPFLLTEEGRVEDPLKYDKGMIKITPLGDEFVKICVN